MQRNTQPPVDQRLKPWYDRCKVDHERLATIADQHSTRHQVKLQYEESRRVATALATLHEQVDALTKSVQALQAIVDSGVWQPQLCPPDLGKLPERSAVLPARKRGSKAAAAG